MTKYRRDPSLLHREVKNEDQSWRVKNCSMPPRIPHVRDPEYVRFLEIEIHRALRIVGADKMTIGKNRNTANIVSLPSLFAER